MPVDLRSDTVTHPTEAMLDAMRKAPLGDDGREGDPTIARLERLAAERTGKEAALFVVSGTMGNLVALLAHGQRGGDVLLERNSHILRSEMGGIAGVAGLYPRPIAGARGAMDVEAVREAVNSTLHPHRQKTALICMETTHNDAGGAVLPLAHMKQVYALGLEHGIPVHTDGARLFNAAIKLGVNASDIAKHTDTLTFCISKGLSAPVGSLLVGSKEFITKARAYRRMLGGNLRQGGVVAAAGIVALDSMVDRLAEDHANARLLAEGLQSIDASLVDLNGIETNIVQVETRTIGRQADDVVAELQSLGVLAGMWSKWVVRMVTHRSIGSAEVEQAVKAFGELRFAEGKRGTSRFQPRLSAAV